MDLQIQRLCNECRACLDSEAANSAALTQQRRNEVMNHWVEIPDEDREREAWQQASPLAGMGTLGRCWCNPWGDTDGWRADSRGHSTGNLGLSAYTAPTGASDP